MTFTPLSSPLIHASPARLSVLRDLAAWRFDDALAELSHALDAHTKANFNPDQPRDWRGRWAETGAEGISGGRQINAPESWSRPSLLNEHFKKHGKDFGAVSKTDYAKRAEAFRQRAIRQKLPMVIDKDGFVRVYESRTNTFGVYGPDGKTSTFFKPKPGARYFQEQIDIDLAKGGRLLNANTRFPGSSRSSGGRSGGGGGGLLWGSNTPRLHDLIPASPWNLLD